jgi:hypothetical protein
MSAFSLIQQPNNTYELKFDMGITCYKGIIDVNLFPEELKAKYIDIVNEAIQYFLKESPNETKIVSMFEYPNTADVNYFMIAFQRNDQFVNYQRFIKIEMHKINKTINDYLFDFDQRITTNKNNITSQTSEVDDLIKKNNAQDIEIRSLKDTMAQLTERVNRLETQRIMQTVEIQSMQPIPKQPTQFIAPIQKQNDDVFPLLNNNLNPGGTFPTGVKPMTQTLFDFNQPSNPVIGPVKEFKFGQTLTLPNSDKK